VTKDRFSIRDNKRLKYFYVYINNVSTADSGTYWCGSDRKWDHAEVNKIHLVVGKYMGTLVLYTITQYQLVYFVPMHENKFVLEAVVFYLSISYLTTCIDSCNYTVLQTVADKSAGV